MLPATLKTFEFRATLLLLPTHSYTIGARVEQGSEKTWVRLLVCRALGPNSPGKHDHLQNVSCSAKLLGTDSCLSDLK